MSGNFNLVPAYPLNAYRGGDAFTGAPTLGKPVVVTPLFLDGSEHGHLCFGYDSAREIGYAVGLSDNESLQLELEQLKQENAHLRQVMKMQREMAIQAVESFSHE